MISYVSVIIDTKIITQTYVMSSNNSTICGQKRIIQQYSRGQKKNTLTLHTLVSTKFKEIVTLQLIVSAYVDVVIEYHCFMIHTPCTTITESQTNHYFYKIVFLDPHHYFNNCPLHFMNTTTITLLLINQLKKPLSLSVCYPFVCCTISFQRKDLPIVSHNTITCVISHICTSW